jgi:uncharacterized paraquat-inducible protein A
MDRHPQSCPACQHRFVPWQVGRISTWSCIHCPRCNAALNRRRDLQFFRVFLPQIASITLIFNLPINVWQRVLVASVVVSVGYVVDALTVKLMIAKEWRGIRGYAT